MTGLSQAGWLARALWIETAVAYAGDWCDIPDVREQREWDAAWSAAEQWEAMWEVNY